MPREPGIQTGSQHRAEWLWRAVALYWSIQILWLSTSNFSSEHTVASLGTGLSILQIRVAPDTLDRINLIVRKLAHIAEYAVFGGLLARTQPRLERRLAMRCWRPALVFAAFYALTDEWHQVYVVGRGPSLIDWSLDCLGAEIGITIFTAFLSRDPSFPPGDTKAECGDVDIAP
ncbi:MAG: putative rane protein [Bryobacterales bacterium]|jgi:VanZ family protein|nr:putative rane protein [Bryobacterales bacterium]